MEDHKILITTSGIGSRLGSLTEHTNKCLVRVGDKPSISHILDFYGKQNKFVITTGHHGDKVIQFLKLAYQDWNFEFVEVDKYKGKGSSLGYSISLCREILNSPFIFHACDTILEKTTLPNVQENWLLSCKKYDASSYRTLLVDGDFIVKVREKGELEANPHCYTGVAGIRDHDLFFQNLNYLLSEKEDVSDADIVNMMMAKVKFKLKEIEEEKWFDIGNATSLDLARKNQKKSHEVLDKNDESIFFIGDVVIKFFSDEKTNLNRVKRANILSGFVPKILNSSRNFYSYGKEKGTTFSESANPESFKNLLTWSKENFWKPIEADEKFTQACRSFYVDKTIQRISRHLEGRKDERIILNGVLVPNAYELIEMLDKDWISKGVPVRFHGDFILENIIRKDDGSFVFIDWRQDFNGLLDRGDIYYDLAKLNHNLCVSHEMANKGLYLLNEVSSKEKKIDIMCSARLMGCKKILMNFVEENKLDKKKIEVMTALIWLNMSGIHQDNFGKFLFNWGKYNLFLNL
jgi:choline kinase